DGEPGECQREVVDVVCGSQFREGISGTAGATVDTGGVHRRHEGRVGTDDDDRRAGPQMFEARVHQVQHADEIDVDGVGEGLRWQARGQGADARVGDHDVQAAELGHACI